MSDLYYTVFFTALPVMCVLSNVVMIAVWLPGSRRQDAVALLYGAGIGAVLGYGVALIYFGTTRDLPTKELLKLSQIGVLVGAGYLMLAIDLLPKKLKKRWFHGCNSSTE